MARNVHVRNDFLEIVVKVDAKERMATLRRLGPLVPLKGRFHRKIKLHEGRVHESGHGILARKKGHTGRVVLLGNTSFV